MLEIQEYPQTEYEFFSYYPGAARAVVTTYANISIEKAIAELRQ